jgi:hypothetical protein
MSDTPTPNEFAAAMEAAGVRREQTWREDGSNYFADDRISVGISGQTATFFKAETLCPACVIGALPTGPGELFDGWTPDPDDDPEWLLGELAGCFEIDDIDESSFDSDDFPKTIPEAFDETCDGCGADSATRMSEPLNGARIRELREQRR